MADQITIERSLIERTIESLENWLPYYLRFRGYPVLEELRAALSAPAQPEKSCGNCKRFVAGEGCDYCMNVELEDWEPRT